MPRLATSLLRQARRIDPLLVPLLKTCRELQSASNELRWLREHVNERITSRKLARERIDHSNGPHRALLRKLCNDRARGQPLQYILGSTYFGPLEIRCRRGVLIPRPETASVVEFLAQKVAANRDFLEIGNGNTRLRVLDLCTGTGCMSLLFAHLLGTKTSTQSLRTLGIDISPTAIRLARMNSELLSRTTARNDPGTTTAFSCADVLRRSTIAGRTGHQIVSKDHHALAPASASRRKLQSRMSRVFNPQPSATVEDVLEMQGETEWDIVLANPPYISDDAFRDGTTEQSVRGFEPRLALVPPCAEDHEAIRPGDTFYPRLLDIASKVKAKVVLMEVGAMEQALRVAAMALSTRNWVRVEIWRDGVEELNLNGHDNEAAAYEMFLPIVNGCPPGSQEASSHNISVVGARGREARAVVCWRK